MLPASDQDCDTTKVLPKPFQVPSQKVLGNKSQALANIQEVSGSSLVSLPQQTLGPIHTPTDAPDIILPGRLQSAYDLNHPTSTRNTDLWNRSRRQERIPDYPSVNERQDYENDFSLEELASMNVLLAEQQRDAKPASSNAGTGPSSSSLMPEDPRHNNFLNPSLCPAAIQSTMVWVLQESKNTQCLADDLSKLCQHILNNAAEHHYDVSPTIINQLQRSLEALLVPQLLSAETAFHIATIHELLCYIPSDGLDLKPVLLDGPSTLFLHALEKFIVRLHPVAQIKNQLECIVHLGSGLVKFIFAYPDTTKTLAYVDHVIDMVSNLHQVSAEAWATGVAECAADMVVGAGIGKTIQFLAELELIEKAQKEVAATANKLKQGIDHVLAERPFLVTAEGVVIETTAQEAGELVALQESIQKNGGSVIKNSKKLQEAESKIQNQIIRAVIDGVENKGIPKDIADWIRSKEEELLKIVKESFNDLILNGKQIKREAIKAKYISHAFSRDHLYQGIMGLDNDVKKAYLKFIDLVREADAQKLLVQGDNTIRTCINKIKIDLRVRLSGDLLQNLNAYVGHSNRIFNNLIILPDR